MKSEISAQAKQHAVLHRQLAKEYEQFASKVNKTKVPQVVSQIQALEPDARWWVSNNSFTVAVPVKSMKHISEVLEAFQAAVPGLEFDTNWDSADGTARTFYASTGIHTWLNVRAEVKQNDDDPAATCRRVQVGTEVKEVAKYEIRCEA